MLPCFFYEDFPVLAIFTNSFDATTDLIINRLDGRLPFFRFNSDLLSDYSIEWEPGKWEVCNTITSDKITSCSLTTAYWRKPLEMLSEVIPGYEEPFYVAEIRYAFREIINSIIRSGKFRLVEPFAERRVGKFYQLEKAGKYFITPKTRFMLNSNNPSKTKQYFMGPVAIAKSISGAEVSQENVMYTSKIDINFIDNQKPWYIQELVIADFDITCAFVAGKCIWAKRSRLLSTDCIDVRESQGFENDWEPYTPTQLQESSVIELMQDLSLEFGRIDFLEKEGQLIFLEVNPNGQYAWLDIDHSKGLIDRVIKEIAN